MSQRYVVGDRVRVAKPLYQVAADRIGTVVAIYLSAPGFYDVQLDGEHLVRIFTDALLLPAAPACQIQPPSISEL